MKVYFTICANNYLAYAKVLGKSLKQYEKDCLFYIFLCDEKNSTIDYSGIADEVITVAAIEPAIEELALKYNIIELSTCVKPRAAEYLFTERKAEIVVYIDPDIKLFHSLAFLEEKFAYASILLTPHIYTPISLDNKEPAETTFLNFGIYNLGFIGLRNTPETLRFIAWWKERTYEKGYIDVYKGIFVDQLPVNFVPIFFKDVLVLEDMGLNMAPWNLHERYLSIADNRYIVNKNIPLKFFHFSSFKAGPVELPVFRYNRFSLKDRPDLLALYSAYNDDLKNADYIFYSNIENVYAKKRNLYLRQLKRKKWMNRLLLKGTFNSKTN